MSPERCRFEATANQPPLEIAAIVPCKNERAHLGRCLRALCSQGVAEIHVMDNGSTDGCPTIARLFGSAVTVHHGPHLNLSQLRNLGARRSTAAWLAFVDADIEVAADWMESLARHLAAMCADGRDPRLVVTGGTAGCPHTAGAWQRAWVHHLSARDTVRDHYVNAGHTIVSRRLFEAVGGFDERYETREDVVFCAAARKAGATISKGGRIRATHHRYPGTLRSFYRREKWHARGMLQDLHRQWQRRDALFGAYYLALPVGFALCAWFSGSVLWPLLGLIAAILLPVLALLMAERPAARDAGLLAMLFVLFGAAKAAALCSGLTHRRARALAYWRES